jgi:acyl-CoA dehydrogenase
MIDYQAFDRAIGLNWYALDPNLQAAMDRLLEPADRAWAEERLTEIGGLAGGLIAASAEVIDKNTPRLERYDRWGEETNRVVHHPAALAAKRACWESGMSGSRLRRESQERGRPFPAVVGAAANYLLCQADTGLACATGMTSGVVALVERFASPEVKERLLPRLTAPRFDDAWDGAMFMTERTGGSDLGTLTTTAKARPDGTWALDGFKWFCSNIDAAAIATLARPEGAPAGVKGVALFVVPRWRADGTPNGIRMHRLKDKLGTRTVPTGEVDFVDAEAYLLAGDGNGARGSATDGRGINRMMEMVNTSRFGVAGMGLGLMRRAFLEAAIYAAHRTAWGRTLDEHALVRETLVRMLVDLEAATALFFAAARAMDRRGSGVARLLVPLVKFRATRQGIELCSQAVEMLGGNGYVEDWPTARLLREAQCHTIWEGTENIICLDVLRALRVEGTAQALLGRVTSAIRDAGHRLLDRPRGMVGEAAQRLERLLAQIAGLDRTGAEYRARTLTHRLTDLIQGALLLEEAEWELATRGSARKAVVATLFCGRRLATDADAAAAAEEQACRTLFAPLVRYGTIAPAGAEPVARLDPHA